MKKVERFKVGKALSNKELQGIVPQSILDQCDSKGIKGTLEVVRVNKKTNTITFRAKK